MDSRQSTLSLDRLRQPEYGWQMLPIGIDNQIDKVHGSLNLMEVIVIPLLTMNLAKLPHTREHFKTHVKFTW